MALSKLREQISRSARRVVPRLCSVESSFRTIMPLLWHYRRQVKIVMRPALTLGAMRSLRHAHAERLAYDEEYVSAG